MLYEFEQGNNTAKSAQNISCEKNEGAEMIEQ